MSGINFRGVIATIIALASIACNGEIERADDAVMIAEGEGKESLQTPAFSPDGSVLIYTHFQKGYNKGPSRLYTMPSTGGNSTRLTPDIEEDNDFMDVNLPGSCWNAATDRITFASDRQDADEIWTCSSNGTDLYRLTYHTNPPYYLEPSFSPDGSEIVFEIDFEDSRWEDGLRGEIWKVGSDGTGLARLAGSDSTDDRQPNWSPAGNRILFQRRRLDDQDDWDIYTITPDGNSVSSVTGSSSSDTDASFSPDGTEICYSSDYGGLEYPNLYVIPSIGGTPSRITFADQSEDGAASFSPDGGKVAFESHPGANRETPASIWIIDLNQ